MINISEDDYNDDFFLLGETLDDIVYQARPYDQIIRSTPIWNQSISQLFI